MDARPLLRFLMAARRHEEVHDAGLFKRWPTAVVLTGSLLLSLGCDGDEEGGPFGPNGPTTGSIQVSAITTGGSLDPNGYWVAVDGRQGQSLEVNGTLTFNELGAGEHEVALADVASNCAVTGASLRIETVEAGETAYTDFAVGCTPIGSIQVTVITTGAALDGDGYAVGLDGGSVHSLGINGMVTFSELETGDHVVKLTGVATNCVVSGANPRTLAVMEDATASTSFHVDCALDFQGRIAFTTDRDGNEEIYAIDSDGFSPMRLTENPADDSEPAWSADGTMIAFTRSPSIYVMSAGGTNSVKLTSGYWDYQPTWSPDGTKIAFTREEGIWGGMGPEVYVMNADGSSPASLTNGDGYDPAWSPDGTKIAFETIRDGHSDIYVIDADGSTPVRLTNDSAIDLDPAWSPDGRKIAFETNRDRNWEVYVMDADGSNLVRLTEHPASDRHPAWSPDGTKIVFETNRDGNWEVYVMDSDGLNPVNLTNHPASDRKPAWR